MTSRSITLFFVAVFVSSAHPIRAYWGGNEEQAAAAVKSLGGRIIKDREGKVSSIFLVPKPPDLLKYFSDDDVESIDLAAFSQLKQVTILSNFLKPTITDRSVNHLLKIRSQLESLSLHDARITDAALGKLLRKNKSLLGVSLRGTSISDAVLNDVVALEDLVSLDLTKTKITDKGLKELAKHRSLLFLYLSETAISDAGLREVRKMPGLLCLTLDGTKVTDAGILELAELDQLRSLNVSSTKVTDEGKKALNKLLPNLVIK